MVTDTPLGGSRASTRPVRIGLQIQPQHASYDDLRRTADAAERLGVDVLFTWDHFFPLTGDPDGRHFECWTTLAAWAEQTSHVEIGALVTCNSYRNADLLADMARTVDHISGGRLILGIGAGWFQRDYDEYGYEFGTPGQRLTALAEALPRIRARWAAVNPPPLRDVPVLVGGGGERRTLRIVAEHATIWHSFADAEALAHKSAALARWCAEVGRDPGEIERSVSVGRSGPDDRAEALLAGGASLFVVPTSGPGYDLAGVPAWLAWRDRHNEDRAGRVR